MKNHNTSLLIILLNSFLLSPLAVKRDIAVTILLRCMCVRVCVHACLRMSIQVCLGHNSYIYA